MASLAWMNSRRLGVCPKAPKPEDVGHNPQAAFSKSVLPEPVEGPMAHLTYGSTSFQGTEEAATSEIEKALHPTSGHVKRGPLCLLRFMPKAAPRVSLILRRWSGAFLTAPRVSQHHLDAVTRNK